nr:2'-5' RNA ligase family protein [Virgibacillus ihumii]
MQYFIGVVPPDEYLSRIKQFRQRWRNNSIDEVVEPHITLKAQGGLTEDTRWFEPVKLVCKNFRPFQLSLNEPRFFAEGILYLSAKSEALYKLHRQLVEEISPPGDDIKKYFELDDFVPHLTLGKTNYGLTRQDLQVMAASAIEELNPFPTFDVNFVRVYQEVDNQYRKLEDIRLGESK